MSYFTPVNDAKQYVVVDSKGNVLEYFRLVMAARKWAREHQLDYLDNDLRVIKNDKL